MANLEPRCRAVSGSPLSGTSFQMALHQQHALPSTSCPCLKGSRLLLTPPRGADSSRRSRRDLRIHALTNVKLPATHKEASERALEQLKASSSLGNSEYMVAVQGAVQGPAAQMCCMRLLEVSKHPAGLLVLSMSRLSAGYAMEKKSSIIAVGLTIAHTPVDIREKLSIPEVRWQLAGPCAACQAPITAIVSVPACCHRLCHCGLDCRRSGHVLLRSSVPSLTSRRQQCCPPAIVWSCTVWASLGTG